jgi:hypothetical protein
MASAKKVNDLMDLINQPSEEIDPALLMNNSQPPMVYFLGGSICGCVAAVILVIYMNKNMP